METDTTEQQTHLWSVAHRWLFLSISGLFLLGLTGMSHAAVADRYTYKILDANIPGSIGWTRITGVTDLGKMSGTYVNTNGTERGWLCLTNFADCVAKRSFKLIGTAKQVLLPTDIIADTRSIGTYRDAKTQITRGYTMHSGHVTTIPLPGVTHVEGCALNQIGNAVCTVQDAAYQTAGVLLNLPGFARWKVYQVPGAFLTTANGINNRNDAVGSYLPPDAGVTRGWWLQGFDGDGVTYYPFDAPCGGDTVAQDVNDAGLMAVTCHNMPHEGAVTSYAYDGSRWVELLVEEPYSTVVTRVNNAGQFVGWYFASDGRERGFIASPATNLVQR